jgi:HDIG domain protein
MQKDYLEELLTRDNVVEGINTNINILLFFIPEINCMMKFNQKDPSQNYDLWNHTLLALYYAEELSYNDFDTRLALLLHDIGKPSSYQEGKVRRYPNHNIVSAETTYTILKRLGYKESFINTMTYLIESHDKAISDRLIKSDPELAQKLYQVQHCDVLAHSPQYADKKTDYLYETNTKIQKTRIEKRSKIIK